MKETKKIKGVFIIKNLLINHEIPSNEVRLIGLKGEQLGVVSKNEALAKADEHEVDLICIAKEANPPVCKLMEYSKYQYQQQKKEKEIKRSQTIVVVKEARFSPVIQENDYQTKKNQILSFLEKGNKVKCSVRFKGRQITHHEIGNQLFERLQNDIQVFGVIEAEPKLEGYRLTMTIAPKQRKNG